MDHTPPLTPERVLRRLEWRVVRRLDGRLQGDYRTLFRGEGVDFHDLREYEPGDDLLGPIIDAVPVPTAPLRDRGLSGQAPAFGGAAWTQPPR